MLVAKKNLNISLEKYKSGNIAIEDQGSPAKLFGCPIKILYCAIPV